MPNSIKDLNLDQKMSLLAVIHDSLLQANLFENPNHPDVWMLDYVVDLELQKEFLASLATA